MVGDRQRVWIEDGRLWVRANPPEKGAYGSVCTVWCPVVLEGDITVEFDACCVASLVDANNINAFLHYTHPDGRSLTYKYYDPDRDGDGLRAAYTDGRPTTLFLDAPATWASSRT